jgi:hypothetical protein
MVKWRYISIILDLSCRWRWVVSFTPREVYIGETAPVPTGLETGWTTEPVLTLWSGEKNLLTLSGIEPRPSVLYSPSLYRLSCPGSSIKYNQTKVELMILIRFFLLPVHFYDTIFSRGAVAEFGMDDSFHLWHYPNNYSYITPWFVSSLLWNPGSSLLPQLKRVTGPYHEPVLYTSQSWSPFP